MQNYLISIFFVLPVLSMLVFAPSFVVGASAQGQNNDIMEAMEECAMGYHHQNKKCVKEIQRKPLGHCDGKSIREGDFCVGEQIIEPAYQCQKGQILNHHQCEFIERGNAIASCPSSYEYSKHLGCTRSIEQMGTYMCPQGYKLFDKRGVCASEKFEKSEYICDQITEGGKTKKIKAPGVPSKNCRNSSNANDSAECEEMEADTEAEEADGFEEYSIEKDDAMTGDIEMIDETEVQNDLAPLLDQSKSSVENRDDYYIPDDKSIVKFYSTINPLKKICTFHSVYDPSFVCTKGYSQSFKNPEVCTKEEATKIEEKCPKGSRMEDNVCKVTIKVFPDKSCPDGYEFDGKECVKVIVVPGVLGCDKNFVLTDGKCIKIIEERPFIRCPPNYEIMGKDLCMLRSVQKFHLKCSDDSELVNMKCQSTKMVKPINVCPPEYIEENGHCVKILSLSATLKCPYGLKLTSPGDKCIKKSYFKAVEVCKSGYVLKDGLCYHLCPNPPDLSCPDNDFRPTTQGTCIKIIQVPTKFECPKGYKYEHRYRKDSDDNDVDTKPGKNDCIKVVRTTPIATCPTTYKLKQGSCVRKDLKPIKQTCDEEGYVYDGTGNCVKYEFKNVRKVCPKTHKLFGNFCIQRVAGDNDFVGKIMESVGMH